MDMLNFSHKRMIDLLVTICHDWLLFFYWIQMCLVYVLTKMLVKNNIEKNMICCNECIMFSNASSIVQILRKKEVKKHFLAYTCKCKSIA